ncbi:2-polyprenylphenol hydroxylase [Methylacidiphilum sp. Yel]|uniref:FAD/NAD(P)-binding protein n=1 Tax=Methylacidiphilum sp. Yel TaxID=1847730 RepID=UPI0010694C4D|nr:FAD/NAD(P)-binding protein [Methylacidiphilum sp. Yel]TFE70232.1 2-polyprenylphenol hydroxylase [Methylacidiphilum sp. Yel]
MDHLPDFPENPFIPKPFVIEEKKRESPSVFSLYLRPIDQLPFYFLPGQFNMLSAIGGGEAAISIASDPTNPHILIHTLRIVGNVTKALSKLDKNDFVLVRGPYGRGWPIDLVKRKTLILVAGGIGLPPLLPLLYIAQKNKGYFKNLILLYGARTKDDLLFMPLLYKLKAEQIITLHVSVDRPSRDWKGQFGTVTALIPSISFDNKETFVFSCGPEIMMRFMARAFIQKNLPKEHIFFSMERNMKCAIGICGHCQLSPFFICKDGPVFPYEKIEHLLTVEEL